MSRQAAWASKGLFVSDPEQLDGLTLSVPSGSLPVSALASYDTRGTTRRKVKCSLCASKQPHNRGFVVILNTGEKVLIGRNCGELHFGDGSFQKIAIDLERQQEAAFFEARTAPMLAAIDEMRPQLISWERATRRLSRFLTDVRITFPVFWSRLREAAERYEGRLVVAETAQVAFAGRDGESSTKTEFTNRSVGKIPYPEAFRGVAPGPLLKQASDLIIAAASMLSNDPSFVKRKAAFADLRRARALLVDCERVHLRTLELLDVGWWPTAVAWAQDPQEYLEFRKRKIIGRQAVGLNEIVIPTAAELGGPCRSEIEASWP